MRPSLAVVLRVLHECSLICTANDRGTPFKQNYEELFEETERSTIRSIDSMHTLASSRKSNTFSSKNPLSQFRGKNISSSSIDLALHRKSTSGSCWVETNMYRQGSQTSYTNVNSNRQLLSAERSSSTPSIWSTSVIKMQVTESESKSEPEFLSGQAGGRRKVKSLPVIASNNQPTLKSAQSVLSPVSSNDSLSSRASILEVKSQI